MSKRRRDSISVSVDVSVDIDEVLDELSDDELLEELQRRGKEFRTNGKTFTPHTLREWADNIERGRVGEVVREMRLMAFEMQPALDVSAAIKQHPFLRFKR